MKSLKLIILSFVMLTKIVTAQNLNPNWEKDLQNSLYQMMACDDSLDDISPCNVFVGESLNKVYKINDFYSKSLKRYMTANEISDFLKSSTNWTKLGTGTNQNALNDAQGYANQKKAIVAVYKNTLGPNGHIALILPGKLESSGSWGLMVPNSASFFISKPHKSYIGKKLSEAFSPSLNGEVELYGRNY